MQSAQAIQQCIQMCQETTTKLHNMANTETDPMKKNHLVEGAHHLTLCIEECNYSLQQVQSGMA